MPRCQVIAMLLKKRLFWEEELVESILNGKHGQHDLLAKTYWLQYGQYSTDKSPIMGCNRIIMMLL